ncbi:ARM repeat-containing protein [Neoconidiobolus thromboides FSU 785]|nr:ARM repeat-containing protein [Neoconidiobolus thromboides FSU 785]
MNLEKSEFNYRLNMRRNELGIMASANQSSLNFPMRRNFTSLPFRNAIPCRYFQYGYCARGNLCHYSHTALPVQEPLSPRGQLNFNIMDTEFYKKQVQEDTYRSSNITESFKEIEPEIELQPENIIQIKLNQPLEYNFEGKTIEELSDEIYYLSRDQIGCRYLQRILQEGDPKNIQLIYEQVKGYFPDLMVDPFGNYLCQKLMEVANLYQFTELIRASSSNLFRISLNNHGTRVVQKILGYLTYYDEREANEAIGIIIESLKRNVVSMIKDLNGNHVVQVCVNKLSSKNNQFVYDSIFNNCIAISTHKHGCCVIQKCFDRANDYQRDQLVIAITQNALSLVQDPYGNYVVQHVLDLSNPAYTMGLIKNFFGHVRHLSVQKFSSNVIEKCIRMADSMLRHQLVNEIMCSDDLEMLIDDSYANYVVQTCLDFADNNQRDMLIDRIRPIILNIKNSPHIKGIQSRILNPESRQPRRPTNFDLSPFNSISKSRYPNHIYQFNTLPLRTRNYSSGARSGFSFNLHKKQNRDEN